MSVYVFLDVYFPGFQVQFFPSCSGLLKQTKSCTPSVKAENKCNSLVGFSSFTVWFCYLDESHSVDTPQTCSLTCSSLERNAIGYCMCHCCKNSHTDEQQGCCSLYRGGKCFFYFWKWAHSSRGNIRQVPDNVNCRKWHNPTFRGSNVWGERGVEDKKHQALNVSKS